MTTILVQAVQRRILWFSGLAVLLTGIAVAAAVVMPLASMLRAAADERLAHVGTIKVMALAATGDRLIEVTRQVTSRSVIRDELEAYNRGERTLEELQAFTADRLADAMRQDTESLGITRLGPGGEALVSVGEAIPAALLDTIGAAVTHADSSPLLLGPLEVEPGIWRLVVGAPIASRSGADGGLAGVDVVLFAPRVLVAQVVDGPTVTMIATADAGGELAWIEGSGTGGLVSTTLPEGAGWRVSRHAVPSVGWELAVAAPSDLLYTEVDGVVARAVLVVAGLLAAAVGILLLLLRPLAGHMLITTQELQDQVRELSTLRAELETERRQLAESNAELEQFAYAASHDMRQPLRMVIGFLSLVQRRATDSLDGETRGFVQEAVDGARRLNGMIEGLLDYSRVGRLEAALGPVELHGAVARAEANLSGLLAESGGEVIYGRLPTVMAERSQMARLFQNLLENALKYRAPDRPPHITVTAEKAGGQAGMWTIRVADNGRGMNPREAPRAFGLFQRLTSDGIEGTGLGLTLCQKIVSRHGGTIFLETEVGVGTTVVFTLPATDDAGGAAPQPVQRAEKVPA